MIPSLVVPISLTYILREIKGKTTNKDKSKVQAKPEHKREYRYLHSLQHSAISQFSRNCPIKIIVMKSSRIWHIKHISSRDTITHYVPKKVLNYKTRTEVSIGQASQGQVTKNHSICVQKGSWKAIHQRKKIIRNIGYLHT